MLLKDFKKSPISKNQYIERYINDGSPSGFTTIYTTSPETSPFGLVSDFHPYICVEHISLFKTFGEIPTWAGHPYTKLDNWILVHPDMINNSFFKRNNFKLYKNDELKVSPTSSGRTVQICNKPTQDYVKLHYKGILGRVMRDLPYNKAIGGPETSRIILKAIDAKILPKELTILPETGARVLETIVNGKKEQWGMVWRESKPYSLNKKFKYLFPIFSLFSFDKFFSHEFPLLKQIIDESSISPEKFIIDVVISPLLKCYFELILKLGLQAEWNAQNLLIGFNENFDAAQFIMRDLESVDKDLTIMNSLNLKNNFESYPYKCISSEQYNYTIKHSFMYDFKLGDYILDPLVIFLSRYYRVNYCKLQNKIKEIAQFHIEKLPKDFFPKNKWYSFEKVLVDQTIEKRPYLEHPTPKFRF